LPGHAVWADAGDLGELAADSTGRSLWDIEDEELAGVIERFRQDLARRAANVG
jgi:hypothetical protein